MQSLARRAWAGAANLLSVLAVILFATARTLRWWQAWTWLAVFAACVAALTLHLLRHDRALLERRLQAGPAAEQRKSQKIIQALAAAAFLATFVVCGLDHHAGWSRVPGAVALLADLCVAAGFWIVFRVFRENTFTAAAVQVDAGQTVVTTGPYRRVRHPMYSGALLLMFATPPALGSWPALACAALLGAVIVARLLDEERLLTAQLAGYAEYRERVRHRLIPRVW